jgi:hypothetical protein
MKELITEVLYSLRDCTDIYAKLRTLDDLHGNAINELGNAVEGLVMVESNLLQLIRKYIEGDIKNGK